MENKRSLLVSLIIVIVLVSCLFIQQANYEAALAISNERIESLEQKNKELTLAYFEKPTEIVYETENAYPVVFSNYYVNDPEGSSARTGSGISTLSFDINEYGFYTYEGKVVVACATWEGIHSNEPNLKNVKDVVSGYHVYHYFDEFEIDYNGTTMTAICLDTCGASYKDLGESGQRIDIFIAGAKYAFGKAKGVVYEY